MAQHCLPQPNLATIVSDARDEFTLMDQPSHTSAEQRQQEYQRNDRKDARCQLQTPIQISDVIYDPAFTVQGRPSDTKIRRPHGDGERTLPIKNPGDDTSRIITDDNDVCSEKCIVYIKVSGSAYKFYRIATDEDLINQPRSTVNDQQDDFLRIATSLCSRSIVLVMQNKRMNPVFKKISGPLWTPRSPMILMLQYWGEKSGELTTESGGRQLRDLGQNRNSLRHALLELIKGLRPENLTVEPHHLEAGAIHTTI
ncbi:hypothetical protein IW261DRAFT_1597384, partial [Armillaria novae-zelandiae]